jgi:hypothetical protein
MVSVYSSSSCGPEADEHSSTPANLLDRLSCEIAKILRRHILFEPTEA